MGDRLRDLWPSQGRLGSRGFALLEVVIGSVILAIAAVGLAIMFSTGHAFVQVEADNRVALQLAVQQLEQIRALGFGSTTSCVLPPIITTEGVALTETPVSNFTNYQRVTVLQCVCPNNLSRVPGASSGCGGISLAAKEAKRFTVTVTPLVPNTTTPDPRAHPVTLQASMVLH